MIFGPFLRREFNTSARRPATFFGRCGTAAFVLLVIAVLGVCWDWVEWDRSSLTGMARFTRLTFALLVSFQTLVTLVMAASEVASGISTEREHKTLDALLSTQLSNVEIVLGTAAAQLVKLVSTLVVMLPILLAFVPLGGVDPRQVFLAYAGLASLTFAVAGVSSVASIGARDRRSALSWGCGMAFGWMFLPFFVTLAMPRLWPWGARMVMPVAIVLLDSSPVGLVMNFGGLARRCPPLEAVWRMIGLQTVGGVFFFLWAIVRLRAACRAVYDGEGRALWILQTRRVRRTRWPACGDDPIFWRERYTVRAMSELDRLMVMFICLASFGCLVFGTYWFAAPAFRELWTQGYGAGSDGVSAVEASPIAMALVRGWSGGPPLGLARIEFNIVLRQVTVVFAFFYVLFVAGFAAEGVSVERSRDTWSGLLVTPLTGAEILRAKMLAAVWRARVWALIMIALWTLGLLSGAVHPLGFAAALVALGVSSVFFAALGISQSLWARTVSEASSRTILPVMLLIFSPIALALLPPATRSVFMGVSSTPFHVWLSLLSYEDVRDAFRSGAFPQLRAMGIETGEGAVQVLAMYLIGLIGQAAGAVFLIRAAVRGFDAAVGRPMHPRAPHGENRPVDSQ